MSPLDAEDEKLLTLARSARVRTGAPDGAAVRDDTGRTYAAAGVRLPSLSLSALQAAIATAASSGAKHFEAAVVAGDVDLTDDDRAVLADVGNPTVHLVGADGTPRTPS